MARVEITETVFLNHGAALVAAVGASVQVNVRDGAAATVYQAATGAATFTNPLTSDSSGRIEGWLEPGAYDLVVSGPGISTYTQRFEAIPGGLFGNANATIRVGSGTGSLTDNATDGPMALKVKFDSASGDEPSTPIQANLNIVAGSAAGDVQGFVSRIDVSNTTGAGDTVALWGDVFVNTASARPTWGLNTYVAIETGSGYTTAAVGAEIGVRNNAAAVNPGGGIHVVSHGTTDVRFGMLYGGASGEYNVEHSILMSSTTPPTTNAIYYGPLSAPNDPSGTALFRVNAAGAIFAGPLATFGQTLSTGADAIAVQRTSNTFPRLALNTDGRIFFGSGSGAVDANIGRSGANIFTVGPASSCALEIGTAGGASSGFLQMWELTADPSAPATNAGRLYLKDNGAGKTQLCVRFPTGAVQVLSTEP